MLVCRERCTVSERYIQVSASATRWWWWCIIMIEMIIMIIIIRWWWWWWCICCVLLCSLSSSARFLVGITVLQDNGCELAYSKVQVECDICRGCSIQDEWRWVMQLEFFQQEIQIFLLSPIPTWKANLVVVCRKLDAKFMPPAKTLLTAMPPWTTSSEQLVSNWND